MIGAETVVLDPRSVQDPLQEVDPKLVAVLHLCLALLRKDFVPVLQELLLSQALLAVMEVNLLSDFFFFSSFKYRSLKNIQFHKTHILNTYPPAQLVTRPSF